MDDSSGVGISDRLTELFEDRQEPRQIIRRAEAFAEQDGQGPAADELHGQKRPAVGKRAQLVDRHDARMLKLAADLGFLDEPIAELGIFAMRAEQDFDGQLAVEVVVVRLSTAPMPPARSRPKSEIARHTRGVRAWRVRARAIRLRFPATALDAARRRRPKRPSIRASRCETSR